jgi:hypothetical protein
MRILVTCVLMLAAGSAGAENFSFVPHAEKLAKVPVKFSKVVRHGVSKGYSWTSTGTEDGGVLVTGTRRTSQGSLIRSFEFNKKGTLEQSAASDNRGDGGYRAVTLRPREAAPLEILRLIELHSQGKEATLKSGGATWSAVPTRDGYTITSQKTSNGTTSEHVFRVRNGEVEARIETIR